MKSQDKIKCTNTENTRTKHRNHETKEHRNQGQNRDRRKKILLG